MPDRSEYELPAHPPAPGPVPPWPLTLRDEADVIAAMTRTPEPTTPEPPDECTGCGRDAGPFYLDPRPRHPRDPQPQYCRDCAADLFDIEEEETRA